MCFPSRQAQPFWFWGYSHFSEVFHPQHHGKPDLMVQPFWITKSTVCVNLLHCPGWVSLIPPPSDALPKCPISTGTTKCHFPHIPKGGNWHVCTVGKKISPTTQKPKFKTMQIQFLSLWVTFNLLYKHWLRSRLNRLKERTRSPLKEPASTILCLHLINQLKLSNLHYYLFNRVAPWRL